MRIVVFLLSVLCFCIFECAPTQLPRSDIPAWDEGILLEESDSERPSLFKRLLSDDNSNYHFRNL